MKISLGRPLIETKADVTQIVKILENDYVWLKKDEAVVLMGHEILGDSTDFSTCVRETIHQENHSFYYVTNKKDDAEINTLMKFANQAGNLKDKTGDAFSEIIDRAKKVTSDATAKVTDYFD